MINLFGITRPYHFAFSPAGETSEFSLFYSANSHVGAYFGNDSSEDFYAVQKTTRDDVDRKLPDQVQALAWASPCANSSVGPQ